MKFFGRQNEIKELEQKVIFYEVKVRIFYK